ncbi:ATP-binding cassette domain-containing protein [Aliivibrio sifiae]|uniref:ABC transporter ATP-binding protein n=1 Tax=Aliivibrio sifiae TaxID=566293 RepID=A0A2S7XJ57_9GAMM|nr:ABC transporter ATP-binding protein [Aliivibrio sifiae]PQJ93767.1 ABC transporter ATP-binding protein [Aliivibrio sifiae]GLR75197.1 ABC transporter ATP-binding protein [Aliivibrio sifiae]
MNKIITSIQFDSVSVHHYSLPRWLRGQPFKALNNINLCIKDKNLAIVGPSGAGKSTLIELLFGLRKTTSSHITLFGNSLPISSRKAQISVSKRMQLIPQEPHTSLNPYYTIYQILREPLLNLKDESDHTARIKETLKEVGLSKKLLSLTAQQLSTGQAQRVAIARALVVKPSILIANEPTSSLDPVSRQKILDLLMSLKSRLNMRLILITHDLQAAQTLCDDILVLDHGEVAEFGPSNQIITAPNHPTTQALINAQSLIIPNQPTQLLE